MSKITVIMGIYNCADTLGAALDSLFAQTYPNWDLVMCDDGSNDATYQVAEAYCAAHPDRITLLRNERNMGLNHTLNRCLALSDGEYIARQDGDDVSLPTRFEKEIAVLEQEPDIAVVSCSMRYFDELGEWSLGGSVCVYPQKEMLVRGAVHCHAPCMIRADVLRAVGGYSEDPRLLRVEDWHLWLKIYAAGYRGKNLKEPLYRMRDDRQAAGRRKFRYRFHEAYVAGLAVRQFRLPVWNYVFTLRPLLVGSLPGPLYRYLHRKKLGA